MLTADNLFKVRKVFRLTQGDVAALANVSTAFISQIERKKRLLPERLRQKLTDELGLTPDTLSRILALYDEFDFVRH